MPHPDARTSAKLCDGHAVRRHPGRFPFGGRPHDNTDNQDRHGIR